MNAINQSDLEQMLLESSSDPLKGNINCSTCKKVAFIAAGVLTALAGLSSFLGAVCFSGLLLVSPVTTSLPIAVALLAVMITCYVLAWVMVFKYMEHNEIYKKCSPDEFHLRNCFLHQVIIRGKRYYLKI